MKLIVLILIFSIFFASFFTSGLQAHEEESEGGNISAISAEPQPTGHSKRGLEKSEHNIQHIQETQKWQPTDYEPGDIVRSTYIVQLGDTLWEIAEAYLEDGIHWTIILEKNKNQIGFLPDGSQALIFPGQILSL